MALFTSVFHLPAGMAIASVHPSASELAVHLACHTASMPCPECHQLSDRIHGQYQRTVADLPCAGRNVILALTVRKFICRTPGCPRKIFTERLPGLVQSYARMTSRLIALVSQHWPLAHNGEIAPYPLLISILEIARCRHTIINAMCKFF